MPLNDEQKAVEIKAKEGVSTPSPSTEPLSAERINKAKQQSRRYAELLVQALNIAEPAEKPNQ